MYDMDLKPTKPDEGTLVIDLALARTDEAPATARRVIATVWEVQRLGDDYVARLVASELVTNAVRYGVGRWIKLRVYLCECRPILEVWDGSPELPVATPFGLTAERGRGVSLVETFARLDFVPRQGGLGKVVRAQLLAEVAV